MLDTLVFRKKSWDIFNPASRACLADDGPCFFSLLLPRRLQRIPQVAYCPCCPYRIVSSQVLSASIVVCFLLSMIDQQQQLPGYHLKSCGFAQLGFAVGYGIQGCFQDVPPGTRHQLRDQSPPAPQMPNSGTILHSAGTRGTLTSQRHFLVVAQFGGKWYLQIHFVKSFALIFGTRSRAFRLNLEGTMPNAARKASEMF